MKIEMSNADVHALLDAAGRDRVEKIVDSFFRMAGEANLTHLQTVAVASHLKALLECPQTVARLERGEQERAVG